MAPHDPMSARPVRGECGARCALLVRPRFRAMVAVGGVLGPTPSDWCLVSLVRSRRKSCGSMPWAGESAKDEGLSARVR